MVPVPLQEIVDFLLTPIAWLPGMQWELLNFFIYSESPQAMAAKYLLLLFPALLGLGAIWCTQLSLYTLPFRSRRIEFLKALLIAWWDTGRAVWLYWVGLFRVVFVAVGWLLTLMRLMFKLLAEIGRQILMAPFTITGKMTQSYFQPGVPWIAFLLLLFWGALEAVIFTYTLYPTISEVLADLVGVEVSPYAGSFLFLFLLVLILGSFACIQALMDAIQRREYKFIIQMALVELFVMFFEVMFLYRELVDAITPWIAQQTGGQVRMGLTFTLTVATFGWIGIRGMTWFLFGQFGTTPLLAFISRRPLHRVEVPQTAAAAEQAAWWRAPVQDFKREVTWLHQKSDEFLDYLCLPVLHVLAAAINFAMILVAASPAFSLPFKSLKEVMETRELLSGMHMQPKKVEP
ncbi:MAG: hypothetical protein HY208_07855 [Nitrospirae bacterium]|nr:hypothetical protein [Nitrospirota bacterium]